MGKWRKCVSKKRGKKKKTLKTKKESGENVGAGKLGRLNDHHTKQIYVALKTKRGKWGKCVNTENGKNL